MKCDCPVCNGKDYNAAGIQLAEKEIIPFFKQELLKLRYPTHPFPLKYKGLLASCFCYSQALSYNRAHGIENSVYHTENKWMVKFGNELSKKFGLPVLHKSELKSVPRLVCEFNIDQD